MQAKREFDWKKFGADVSAIKGKRTVRAIADELGMNHATFWRAASGLPVNVVDVLFLMTLIPERVPLDYLKGPL